MRAGPVVLVSALSVFPPVLINNFALYHYTILSGELPYMVVTGLARVLKYLLRKRRRLMISAGDFRKGITFEINGEPHVILDFQHVKPGKGAAFVRTKYKNILTGATREEAFNPNDKFENAHIETKQMQYLYEDGGLYYFMDQDTYEQTPLISDQVEDAMQWLRENDIATIKFFKDKAFLVEAPFFVELKIIETEPGVKGDTATNVTKAAIVETGATVQVPIFIEEGEIIKIDTRTGDYLGRA